MISRMTHASVFVVDQDRALEFYTNKLGFKVLMDVPMGNGDRWITVCPPDQPELEIVLSPVTRGMFSSDTVELLRDLVQKGTFGMAVFTCRDIFATYEELKARGVEFTKAPKKEFYGIEAIFKDDSGNWFSLGQLEKE